eukprot:Partr_v1_DN28302_c0_g1_i1_m79795 putative Secreted metalloproteinase probably acting as a virulence factor (By similarity)
MKYQKIFAAITVVCATVGDVSAHRHHKLSFAPDIAPRFKSFLHSAREKYAHAAAVMMPYSGVQTGAVAQNSQSTFQYLSEPSSADPKIIAREFIESQLSVAEGDLRVKNSYTSANGVTHIYYKQYVNGLEVENGDANINIDRFGRVVSFGESFFKGTPPLRSSPPLVHQDSSSFGGASSSTASPGQITREQAVLNLLKHLDMTPPAVDQLRSRVDPEAEFGETPEYLFNGIPEAVSDVPVTQKYMQTEQGQLVEVYDIQMEMEENWYHAHVSMETGDVLGLLDWVSDSHESSASYQVFPIGVNDPEDGDRVIVRNPADIEASPDGWHQVGKKSYTTTMGNNVIAHENLDGRTNDDYMKNYRPDGGKQLSFQFPLNLTSQEPGDYLDAAITNLFYWNNVMHDLFYKYGFDEKSGNFQHDNFGKGGKGKDEVIANAQDGAGYNNANFATPPDGKHGKMRMYVWNTHQPHRDGDLENGIIIHEYGHGISTRLTGGPANSGCLGWGESGGMGEGWGDFWATILRMKPEYTRETKLPMGSYAANSLKGIRKFIYSTDMSVNPSTYAYVRKFDYVGVHAKGEVWAVILYDMYWNLVEKNGFSTDWFNPNARDDKKDTHLPAGNIVALQLTVTGLKMQPCRPNFVNARDAILEADETTYGGEHSCEIWRAFAKRGLGIKAASGGREDFTVPSECQ